MLRFVRINEYLTETLLRLKFRQLCSRLKLTLIIFQLRTKIPALAKNTSVERSCFGQKEYGYLSLKSLQKNPVLDLPLLRNKRHIRITYVYIAFHVRASHKNGLREMNGGNSLCSGSRGSLFI